MITTSKQIESELNQTTKRLDELTGMRDDITAILKNLQQGFIDGKTSLDELQAEQGKLTILNESITALETKQNELHSAFQKASLSESNQAHLEQMKATADEAATAYNEFVNHRAELDKLIALHTEKVFDSVTKHRAKQKDFLSLFQQIVPGLLSVRRPEISERAIVAETAAELEKIGLDKETFKLAIAADLQLPFLENAEIIDLAQTNFGNKKYTEQQKAKSQTR